MDYFEIVEDDESEIGPYGDLKRRWALPGAVCASCGTSVSTWSDAMPDADLTGFVRAHELERARQVAWSEYADLAESLRDWLGWKGELPPGMEFGRLEGRLRGKSALDFVFPQWKHGVLLASINARKLMVERWRGEEWKFVPVHLTAGTKKEFAYDEVVLKEFGALHPEAYSRLPSGNVCNVCAVGDGGEMSRLVVTRESLDGAPVLFNLRPRPSVILGSSQFLEVISEAGLSGLKAGEKVEVLPA